MGTNQTLMLSFIRLAETNMNLELDIRCISRAAREGRRRSNLEHKDMFTVDNFKSFYNDKLENKKSGTSARGCLSYRVWLL